jgi:hypothetical protein
MHSPDAVTAPFYAGRATAHLPLVKLAVYRIGGFEAGEEPLVPEPITLRRQTDRNTYLCQFKNDENRAFLGLINKDPIGGFPTKTFGAKQNADNKWVHNGRGEARSLTAIYDFVVVDQQEE